MEVWNTWAEYSDYSPWLEWLSVGVLDLNLSFVKSTGQSLDNFANKKP